MLEDSGEHTRVGNHPQHEHRCTAAQTLAEVDVEHGSAARCIQLIGVHLAPARRRQHDEAVVAGAWGEDEVVAHAVASRMHHEHSQACPASPDLSRRQPARAGAVPGVKTAPNFLNDSHSRFHETRVSRVRARISNRRAGVTSITMNTPSRADPGEEARNRQQLPSPRRSLVGR